MPTTYLEIAANQPPFDFGTDSLNRVMFSQNFLVKTATAVDSFEREMLRILTDAGIVTLGTNAFYGSRVTIPDGAGPYILLKRTGGFSTKRTHDDKVNDNITFQVIVYAGNYDAGSAKANAIWRAFDNKRNITVTA